MNQLFLKFLLAFGLSIIPFHTVRPDNSQPGTEEIIQALKLKSAQIHHSLDRSWPKGVSVEGKETASLNASRIDLQVNFEFNSAQLSTDAQLLLSNLGRALNSAELHGQHFKITGHTDAVGAESYNLDLSKRRAISVQDYLVQRMHIGSDRLITDGVGYSQLADPANPTSALNRRVVVLNLGS